MLKPCVPSTSWLAREAQEGFTGTDYVIPFIGKEGNNHSREIWLYRKSLCENIALRTRAYLHKLTKGQ